MKRALLCIVLANLWLPDRVILAQALPDLESLLNEGQRWWDQNIDEEALPPLPELDLEQVEPLLKQVQDRLQAESLLDLAELRRVADALLPWLERETALRPYVPWLRARLDYFKAAEVLARPVPRPLTVPTPEVPHLPLLPQKPKSPEQPLRPPNPVTVPSQQTSGPLQRVPTEAQQRKVWSDITIVESWPTEARRRVPQLKPIFREEGVPEELVWVAEVESSFDPRARSPAGAAGLYQLMPETARAQGLSTFPFDQRYRPEKNARASCASPTIQGLASGLGRLQCWRDPGCESNEPPPRQDVQRHLPLSSGRDPNVCAAHRRHSPASRGAIIGSAAGPAHSTTIEGAGLPPRRRSG